MARSRYEIGVSITNGILGLIIGIEILSAVLYFQYLSNVSQGQSGARTLSPVEVAGLNFLGVTVGLGILSFIILVSGFIIRIMEWHGQPSAVRQMPGIAAMPAAYNPSPPRPPSMVCPKCGRVDYFAYCPIDGSPMQPR